MIPVIISLRYFPEINKSFGNITNAIKIRKLKTGLLHPVNTFKYISVPMIHKSLNIASEMAEAITVKGIEYNKERTCYHNLRFCLSDYIIVIFFVSCFLFSFVEGV
ncbi:hypothetical protein CSK00_24460 [Salmonella enterica]|nr:hypothetical protein [Salmonella enterica]